MNREERVAERFLTNTTNKRPVYEPRGESTFPDFAIGTTAIEVRRLNVNYEINGKIIGAGNSAISLKRALKREIENIVGDPKIGTMRIYVAYRRPIGRIAKLMREARATLRSAYSENHHQYMEFPISDNVILQCHMVPYEGRAYVFRGIYDLDYDPNLKSTYESNIKVAIEDKEDKALACPEKYRHYWLILVDEIHIASRSMLDSITGAICSKVYEKIVYLNPYSGMHYVF
jgi:hypothetical protein